VNPSSAGGTGGTGGSGGGGTGGLGSPTVGAATELSVPGPTEALIGTPNEVWIAQVYLDLLHKNISAGDLAFWTDQLEADVSRLSVATLIVNSAEYQTDYVIDLYHTLLIRNPAPDDPGIQLQYLAEGHSLEELRAVFLSSDEYVTVHNDAGNPFAWVNSVFKDALGHAADAGSQQFWVGYLQSHSLFDTALAIVESGEGLGEVVNIDYSHLLRRSADSGAGVWFNALVGGARDQDVVANLVASGEYFLRLRPNQNVPALQSWITHAYQDVLGHTPNGGALTFWTGALQGGATRIDVMRKITSSDEYHIKEVNDTYEQVLHRGADSVGLSNAVQLLDSGGTLEQVKANLMASSEYYFSRGGGTDGGFVVAVLSDALSLPPAKVLGDLGFWGPQLAGTTRGGLALQILQDLNAEEALVQNYFTALLRRDGGGGLPYWAGQIQAGMHDEDVVAALASSREYYTRFSNG
jgi:hypothetical protein